MSQGYERTYTGQAVPFSAVEPDDDFLHPVEAGAPFTRIETNLFGFNIPEIGLNANIYLMWHPLFGCMSAHFFLAKGDRIFRHHLEADYFAEVLYLPGVADNGDCRIALGDATLTLRIIEPLRQFEIGFADEEAGISLDLVSTAALPPVGRPGGGHFTQLMHNEGSLTLNGTTSRIDSHYMRDRSWGYQRPEQPERAPPYRWITAWLDDGTAFVIAWLDTGMMAEQGFGDDWAARAGGGDATGRNKWEAGGPTPSLNLRSGWIAWKGHAPRPVVSVTIAGERDASDPLLTRRLALDLTDDRGRSARFVATTRQMLPKMYWQTMITYMHSVDIQCGEACGHGDMMDTFSRFHLRALVPTHQKSDR